MTEATTDSAVSKACVTFTKSTAEFLVELETRNQQSIAEVAQAVLDAVAAGHLVYTAGAGHSVGGVIETFFRAGGLPFVYPLWHPRIFPLNGARDSTAAERTEGLGWQVAEESPLEAGDVLFIFSNSGINAYPVELARYAREVGAVVVAVTSVEASSKSPIRVGARLSELADLVLDTGVPAGDVTWPPENPSVAPLSSVAVAHMWNLVMVSLVTIDPNLGTWQSANVRGDGAGNEALSAKYQERIPAM